MSGDEFQDEVLTAPLPVIETWEVVWSPSIAKLVEALAKAQLKYKPVFKTNENEAYKRGGRVSKYADLATYIDATQEALANEGLVVLQWPDVSTSAKYVRLTSILAHSSGEWMRGTITLPATGRDGFTAQSCGSGITYARRYSYGAITGCASEDDDGNSASGVGSREAAQAVGEEKVAALQAKKLGPAAEVEEPALFYVMTPSGRYEILGAEYLKKLNKDLLKKYWDPNARAILLNDEQLEQMKFEMEQRKTPFHKLKETESK